MSASSRNKSPWSVSEIELLDKLLKAGIPSHKACLMLGRTEMATEHAITKLVFQQLLYRTPEEIAERYGQPVSWVTDELVDPKYSIEDDEEEEDWGESSVEATVSSVEAVQSRLIMAGVLSAFYATVISGAAYYGYLLCNNGFATLT
jgi:hypothetical protein